LNRNEDGKLKHWVWSPFSVNTDGEESWTWWVRTDPEVVEFQLTVKLLSPETHSALISLYTCTVWDFPSVAAVEN
jgi:hypothetical protein